ncbi:DUF5677 domain-containing protein [Bacillus paralicheniformis]|uniref:DUF5677 domain-containing protein n=1 Tax=Bacillus paralicheniformis TaxID=1648923 RepID=UPI0021D013AC|nr:DUF5677 domain-containing protein [Bacillus paralicheniformis]MCU4668581.1 DUF5677 domain-containing protein [Bacillus paralicheniformis]
MDYQEAFNNFLKEFEIELSKSGKDIDKEKINKTISETMKKENLQTAERIYEELKHSITEMYLKEEQDENDFKSRLHETWREAFLLLQGIIKVSEEESCKMLDNFHMEEHSEKRNLVLRVLFKLHSKSIQASKEILSLLKGGYSDGAMARWRSLHEFNIIFRALIYNYKDIDFTYNLIKRFLDYSEIERIKELHTYKKATELLQLPPLSKDDEKRANLKKEEILKKYGRSFEKPNMWAKPLFPQINRTIYFSDFEKLVGIDRLTPYYKQANYQVHASPKGIFQSLTMLNEVDQTSFFLYGGSNYGLSDPGSLTAISLHQITVALLYLKPTIDSEIVGLILQKFVEDCIEAFAHIQTGFEAEDTNKINKD